MDRAIADKLIVAGFHYSMPGAGTFKRDGNGYVFVPVKADFHDTDWRAPAEFGAFLFSELKCETGPAATRGFCLRIVHLERGADQGVDKIDFRSGHVVD